jgi:hypothetical protein
LAVASTLYLWRSKGAEASHTKYIGVTQEVQLLEDIFVLCSLMRCG